MKKVIFSILFAGTFAAIFSCQKEDYNVQDLQTEQKLVAQAKSSSSGSTALGTNSLLSSLVSCDWGVKAVGANVSNCAQAQICLTDESGTIIGPCFTPITSQTKVTVNVLGAPGGITPPPIIFFVPDNGVPVIPQIPGNQPGMINVNGVAGTITFEGTAKVVITVQTPPGVNPLVGSNICTFNPKKSNKGCKAGIFTTQTIPFGIGQNCSVSFPD